MTCGLYHWYNKSINFFNKIIKSKILACSRRRAEMENSGEYVFVSLHCDSMGNYDPLQCDIESESCWCVESKTGDLISSVVPLSLVTKLSCCTYWNL